MSTDLYPEGMNPATGFTCPRRNCNRPVGDRYAPCPPCATELRANADAQFEARKARQAEQIRAAGSDASTCTVCGWQWIPDPDDPYSVRCPSCGERKAA